MNDKKQYQANEAYMVMEYKCDACGNHEHVYNMRDKVTPFGFGCKKCGGGTMSHVNWNMDFRLPEDYNVPVGALMFVDLTPETALEKAKQRVARFDGTDFEKQGDEREELIYNLTNNFMEDCCACNIVRKD